jgi:hypothetical protein
MDLNSLPKNNLEKEYLENPVFDQLTEIASFYDALSDTTMGFVSQGTRAIANLDTYVFTSISGTVESIKEILYNGRLNDAYALLRKYYDSTMINIYTNLYLNDHFSIDNFFVEHIDNWRSGKETIPEYRIISQYIKGSNRLKPITDLLQQNKLYREIRERCNDHTHYNFYYNLLLNDNQIRLDDRVKAIIRFQADLIAIFIQHFAYLFYLNEHYMMSSDYVDYLDMGMTPEEDSQYWVAGFIQEAFDKYVKIYRPDIAQELKTKISMKLQ